MFDGPAIRPLRPFRSSWEWAVAVLGGVLAVGNIFLGLALTFGSRTRTSGVSFRFLLEVVGPEVWGAMFVATGCLGLVGQLRRLWGAALVGHFAAGLFCSYWSYCFVRAALEDDRASLTGVAAYGTLAALHLVVSVTSQPHRRP